MSNKQTGGKVAVNKDELVKQKRRSPCSLTDLVSDYIAIRRQHGDASRSICWMQRNGWSWLTNRVQRAKVTWNEFKHSAGFDEDPIRRRHLSLENIIDEYKRIRSSHGSKAASSSWMCRNGFAWLVRVAGSHRMSWSQFKQRSGFEDTPLRRSQMTIDDLQKYQRELVAKHGSNALVVSWLIRNGHSWFYLQVHKGAGMTWYQWKQMFI